MVEKSSNTPGVPSVGGEYTLIDKLGEGAFGEVYRARHELLGQEFAVKLLKPELSEDDEVRDRFLDEARALIRFSHPNVVQVRHVGEHEGRLYLVMDLIHGVELTDLMRSEGPIEESRAINICRQILAGLEAAHAAGIVHRDLKPSNMLVESRSDGTEHVSILDFGLSKFSAIDGAHGAHRSITGTIVGTLAYMSPEQIKGDKDIDGRSDLFATGLILQEMLQGHHPYPGDSGIVVAAKLLRDPIPPITDDRASLITHATKTALSRALERDRDARFPSVTAFAQALEGKGPPSDTSRVTTIEDTARELARQEAAERKAARDAAKSGKKRSVAPFLVTGVLVAAAAAAFLLLNNGKKEGSEVVTAKAGGEDRKGGNAGAPESGGTGLPKMRGLPPAPEPASPEQPALPYPAAPDSAVPDPAVPDPRGPDPEPPAVVQPAEMPPDPGPATPVPPAVEQPATPPDAPPGAAPGAPPPVEAPPDTTPTEDAALSPKQCCGKAAPLFAAGNWAGARKLYKQAVEKSELTEPLQVASLRGTAESYIAEADQLARSGKIDKAIGLLGETAAWLTARNDAYQQVPRAASDARLQLGFARLHTAEALVETARWQTIAGRKADAKASLDAAAGHYEFAGHQLERDGVRYWEFLIRRSRMHRMRGDGDRMVADVAHTTKTNNQEVPPHMWVAHATAARQLAEARKSLSHARKAAKVAEDGASWQEDKLSRQQWLDLVRVLFTQATLTPAGEDPTALHGKIRYWMSMAEQREPAAWAAGDLAEGRLMTGKAMERYLHGLVMRKRGNTAEKAKAFDDATELLDEAIARRVKTAATGGPLPDALPYLVRAAVLEAAGQDARAARAAAARANGRNPD